MSSGERRREAEQRAEPGTGDSGWKSHGLDVVLVSDGHAPATEGDPDAGLTAEQVIDRHNRILSMAIHPGGTLRLVQAAEVVFLSLQG